MSHKILPITTRYKNEGWQTSFSNYKSSFTHTAQTREDAKGFMVKGNRKNKKTRKIDWQI